MSEDDTCSIVPSLDDDNTRQTTRNASAATLRENGKLVEISVLVGGNG
jgi:hypothetical protein